MAKVQKDNVVLHVEDEDVKHYLSLGYNLMGSYGQILQKGTPQTEGDFRKAYAEAQSEIAELKAQIAELTAVEAPVKRGRKPKAEVSEVE